MSISGKRFLVTGGAGFIGSHIVEYLLQNNAKLVRVIDNLSTGYYENIRKFKQYHNFEFKYGDITNYKICDDVMENIDVVCHQAAIGSVPKSIKDPLTSHHSNVDGFLNVLHAAKENNIKRFVYASSSSVYGDDINLPKNEQSIGQQLSPYAITKYIDELYANIYTRLYNMECIGLRYFNVFGPKQDPHGPYAAVIPKFIISIINNKNPIINGDGTFSRDFTYVKNIVDANIKSCLTNNKECYGKIFNIGTNNQITILELVNLINHILQKNIDPVFGNMREGDIQHSHADITKAKTMLNYTPLVRFEDGLIETIKYFQYNYNESYFE